MLRRTFLVLTVWMLCGYGAASAQTAAFEVGQVWSLKAPLAPTARVRIGRIEGDLMHVSIWGQPAPEGVQEPFVVVHAVFLRAGLAASVDAVVEEPPPSIVETGFESGFRAWREFPGNEPELGTVEEFFARIAQIAAMTNAPRSQ